MNQIFYLITKYKFNTVDNRVDGNKDFTVGEFNVILLIIISHNILVC